MESKKRGIFFFVAIIDLAVISGHGDVNWRRVVNARMGKQRKYPRNGHEIM